MSQVERVPWSFYDKYEHVDDKYLPRTGEGDNLATQIVTATTKLVYKWYNDGDIYDNTYALKGWLNDLSSYANWLYTHVPESQPILNKIKNITTENEYEQLLKELVIKTNDMEFLKEKEKVAIQGTIYDCNGPFVFYDEDEDEC